jgi:DNA-binding transcriptional LysR family regulator
LDLRHLRYFQAVAENLSYSRAAQRLGIAQPALSRAVKELEAALGTQLLDRNRRSVKLTGAGAVLLEETAQLLDRWEEALQHVRRAREGALEELRLGYVGPPTQAFLGRLLADFRQRHPQVALHLEEGLPERIWELVAEGKLTAGLTHPVPGPRTPHLASLALRRERLGAVVGLDHPFANREFLDWAELEPEPLVVLARGASEGTYEFVVRSCQRAGFTPRIAFSPRLVGTVLTYAEAGEGVALVPESVLTPGRALRFVTLRPVRQVPLLLVWREEAVPTALGGFRELLREWQGAGKLEV